VNAEVHRAARLGILALPLTGVLYGVGIALRGAPIADARSPGFSAADFAAVAGGAGYRAGWIMLVAGTVLLVFGYLALFGQLADDRSARSVLPAMIMTVSGVTLSVGVFGVFAFGYPAIADQYAAGETSTTNLIKAVASGALGPYSSVGGLLYLVGTSWFAVAIWRSGRPYRWAGVLLPVYYLLLLAPVFGLGTDLAYVLEFIGAGVLTAAGLVLSARASGIGQQADADGGARAATGTAGRERVRA
jgi:hypothetical protein